MWYVVQRWRMFRASTSITTLEKVKMINELVERLRKRNETGTLVEITEEDQAAAADTIESLAKQLEGVTDSFASTLETLQIRDEQIEALQDVLKDALSNLNTVTDMKNAEIEALQADAERYRWLARKVSAHGICHGWQFGFPTALTLPANALAMRDPETSLGQCIDAAMQKDKL